MADTLCTKCRNPECEYAGRKVWVMICAHEYVAPPMTRGDQMRAMTDEELAEFMASQVVAMADAIFGIAERVLMEKRGYKISFTDNFTPDLVEIKREYLEMLKQEVQDK